ncbi:MAG: tyrosine-type recombinase/integrase [Vulcanibacillus sp.]
MPIEKRGPNSFRLIVEAGYDANNKRIQRKKTINVDDKLLKTPKKLRDYLELELAKFKIEIEAGEYIAPEKMAFINFVEEWKAKYAEKELAPTTLKNYLGLLNTHILPVFGCKRLDQIKTFHIVSFLDELSKPGARKDGRGETLSGGTLESIYRVLKNIFNRCVDWKIIKDNPMNGVRKPRPEKRKMKYYEEQEAEEVITNLYKEPDVWRLYFLGAMLGGFRRGELLGLEWSNVSFEDNTLDIQKSISLTVKGQAVVSKPKTEDSEGIVVMPEWYMQELKNYQTQWEKDKVLVDDKWIGGDNQYVFHNGLGKPFHYTTPSHRWIKFRRRYNLKEIRLHDLRHTAATLLIEAGADLKAIQERLRHSRYQTTADTYIHITKKINKDTAEKLDKFNPRKKEIK